VDPVDDLRTFLDESPSPHHAARTVATRLLDAGFAELELGGAWTELPAAGFVIEDGSVVAWRSPEGAEAITPFRLAGAHTDSPCLRVKPRPDDGAVGWKQLNVEVYGGILNNSWLDRDLGVAGALTMPDGSTRLVDVHRGVARVPQLAVHLDRSVNDGLKLDPQQHLRPVWGVGNPVDGDFAAWIAEQAGCDEPAFWDLCLYDVQPAAVIGGDQSLLASGRLDNQVSCWSAASALIAAEPLDAIAAIVLNDHEEVGSASTTGAAGPLVERVM
jgi:aspartyl aminopeptidase